MIVLLSVILLAAFILGIVAVRHVPDNVDKVEKVFAYIGFIINAFLLIGTLVLAFALSYEISTSYTIDEKISMYEEENAKIERSIGTTAKNYMKFESDTYTDLKDKDFMCLVSIYPELKSDKSVQQQIKRYNDNNEKIKQLKEDKINVSKDRWLLYFGH